MSLVSPTDLESLTCSFCSKYLSVFPVTVFSDKKIKCGRASCTVPVEGTLSLYNLVAENVKFPCIFRYEGCRILSNQLELHENEQHSNSTGFKCCFCDLEVESTYYFPRHVKSCHQDAIIPTPGFWMDLTQYKITKQFLYQENDVLVVVGYTYSAAEPKLLLNFKELGSSKQMHKFELYFAGNHQPITTDDTLDTENELEIQLSKKPNEMVLCQFRMWSENSQDTTQLQVLDGATSKAVLLFTFNNIQALKQGQTNYSPFVYTVAGMVWRLAVRRIKSVDDLEYLKVVLERTSHDSYEPCSITVSLEIQTVQVEQPSIVRHFVDDNFSSHNVWDFVPWDSLVDATTGYVDSDGNCRFNVTLQVS